MTPILRHRTPLCLVTSLVWLAVCVGRLAAQESIDIERFRADAVARWEAAMVDFDQRNQTEVHPDQSILVIGSSSVRRWETIDEDLAPYHPIARGFGGSRWSDVAVFAERLIRPHRFRGVVFFVANDITGGANDRTPEEVAALFAHVHGVVRDHNPAAPVFYIAVTPTESRWRAWEKIKKGNSTVRALCAKLPNTYFIGTESIYLDGTGRPKPELFVEDKLHLNREGYIRWSAAIKSHLDTVFDGALH